MKSPLVYIILVAALISLLAKEYGDFFIIMAVVANTMAMTTRERIGEYAILKTLGFGGGHITALIFGESLVITIMGCLLGIVLTFPATKILSHELGTYFPVFNIGRETLLLSVVAALAIAFVSARRRHQRLDAQIEIREIVLEIRCGVALGVDGDEDRLQRSA